jgi:NCAIR mutase (PurE)-related protein
VTSNALDELRKALASDVTPEHDVSSNGASSPEFRIDGSRWQRTGIPEVVHAEHKSDAAIVSSLRALTGRQGRAIASRVHVERIEGIAAILATDHDVEVHEGARCIVAIRDGAARAKTGGAIGVLSAGTSDVPIASEAALIAAEMGAEVLTFWDVGVAGLHRLMQPLGALAVANVEAIVVAAGMDGALPSVVAGLVDVPVIGLPTSVGYGFGGQGIGAMTTMLQSCAPGLVVVNIDNGIGAGATAALIANRAARLRSEAELQS